MEEHSTDEKCWRLGCRRKIRRNDVGPNWDRLRCAACAQRDMDALVERYGGMEGRFEEVDG